MEADLEKNQGFQGPNGPGKPWCILLYWMEFYWPTRASIDAIRVVIEILAVAAVADGIEYVGINAVLDVMHRAVGEYRIGAGRMRRSKEEVRVPVGVG